jgi:ParB-like chromosome segregation protein Spo0J
VTDQQSHEDLDSILQEIGLGDESTEVPVSHAKPISGPLPMPPDAHGTVDPRTIVIPPDRNRRFFDHKGEASLKSLRESIERWGLIHPPVVTRDNVLVVGERRVRCCLELVKTDARFEQIPVRYPEEVTPKELRAIELEENIKRADTLWHERELGLAELVEFNKRERGLNRSETADEIGYDKSTVTNRLKVAREIKAGNAEVLAARSVREAERIIKRQEDTKKARAADLLREVLTEFDPGARAQIITADVCELIKTYRGPPADVGHCDLPFGIGADEFGQGVGPGVWPL